MTRRLALFFALALASACGSETPPAGPVDGASATDTGVAATDAGLASDAGSSDAAGLVDSGVLGMDAELGVDTGTATDADRKSVV